MTAGPSPLTAPEPRLTVARGIVLDAGRRELSVELSEGELKKRKAQW